MNLDKENYKKLAYKVFESLKDDKNQLELVENWENIPNEYGWKNSELYIRNNKLDKGLDLIKDLQAGDMRRSGESLERNKGLEKLKTNAEFKKLVQNTKYIDTITNPNHPTTQAEFDAGVGLFELYKFKAYEIVKNYKEIGIDKAVSEANRHLDSCLKYTYTYPNATAIYFLKGKLFLQAEDYVSSVNAYYNAIYFSPDSITKEWIDISIAGLQVKSLMEDELFDRRKKGIKGNTGGFYDDYKKHRTWILDLCDKYIAKFPEDPLGYYARAKTRYKFNGYYYNDKRVKDAKKTIELCKKLGYKIPEDCYEMAKEYWNQTPPTAKTNSSSNTNTASRPTRCYTNCTTCKGRGLKETNSTCGSCTGTGKRGRCYACNGRGRKYFTSNIQTCYTCGGKGTLSCYMCNGSGRKYAHKHCSTCSGSGYKCD